MNHGKLWLSPLSIANIKLHSHVVLLKWDRGAHLRVVGWERGSKFHLAPRASSVHRKDVRPRDPLGHGSGSDEGWRRASLIVLQAPHQGSRTGTFLSLWHAPFVWLWLCHLFDSDTGFSPPSSPCEPDWGEGGWRIVCLHMPLILPCWLCPWGHRWEAPKWH